MGDRTPARRAAHAYSQAWYAACTDARLMRAACDADDQRAFEELVVRHQDRLYTFARRLTGDSRADAAECVQDAFLAAWRGRREWRGEASVTTWLYSITRRKALDKLRQRDGALLVDAIPERSQPDDESRRSDQRLDLMSALLSLSLEFREVAVLVDILTLPLLEVARVTEAPESTVKTRLHRARRRLAEMLEQGSLGVA